MNFISKFIRGVFIVGLGQLIGSFSAIAIYIIKFHATSAPSNYILYPLAALTIIHSVIAITLGIRYQIYYNNNGYYGDVDYHINARAIYGGMISGGLLGAILLYIAMTG